MSADEVHPVAGQGTDAERQKEKEYFTACRTGDITSVKALIEANVDINATQKDWFFRDHSALDYAASNGHLEIVNTLVTAGIDINKELKDKYGNTVGGKALERASEGGHLDIVNALFTAGVDLNKELKDAYGYTVGGQALVTALEEWHLDIVNALITAGVDLNKEDTNGDTVGEKVYITAAGGGHFHIMNALIASGIDINKEGENGITVGGGALVKAARQGKRDIVNALIGTGVDVQKTDEEGKTVGEKALKAIVENFQDEKQFDIVIDLIKMGVDVNKEGVETVGEKILICAALFGRLDFMKSLIEAGVDVNKKDEEGKTVGEQATLEAASYGHLGCVNSLITAGVDLNKMNEKGKTVGGQALVAAAANGETDMMNTIVDMGVDLKEEKEKGESVGGYALVQAAAADDGADVVNVLIGLGVDLNEEFRNGTVGESALFKVLERDWLKHNHLKIVDTFVRQEVHMNKKDVFIEVCEKKIRQIKIQEVKSDWWDPDTNIAIHYKMYELFTGKNEKGKTVGGQALVAAAANGETDKMNTIVDMGVDLKEEKEKGESVGGYALVQAAAADDGADVVNVLIGLGVDLNEENGTVGESALFKVLERDRLKRNHLKIVDTFVRQEVHMNKRDVFIEVCEKKIKQIKIQEVKSDWWDPDTNIAILYKMYELFTGKTKEAVIETMTRDMEQIKDSNYKYEYKKAITWYKDGIPAIIKEVRLDEEQEMQMVEAFASGSERDFCVRSNFVGFTEAGKTTLMWQLFLITFSPKDIESTNGIDISLGYCSIDLRTEQWKRHKESAGEKRARRFQAIAVDKKKQRDKDNTSDIAIDLTKSGCSGIQTQQRRQQRMSDNSRPERKSETIREPTKVSVRETSIPIPAMPPTTKTDQYLIVRRIKQAKTKAGRRVQEANATGIDYAGQATYYALHQLFLSKRGVNIIVMDSSKDFDENIKDEDVRHIGSKQKANSKDFFRFWANSLRYYLPERSSKHIIIVFTHQDLVLNQDDLLKKIYIVKEIIEEMGMRELFFETVFCVNGNDPNDKVLQELRHIILQFSKGENHWGQEMPSSWLLLEDKLMQRKTAGHQVMTIDEVNEMHLKSALPLGSQDELLLFLKIHHEIGTLMYFADVGVMNITILNPQWLIDCLKLVICTKRFRDPRYVKQWDRLHEKGVVDKAFLYSVWESTPGRFFEFREDLILLMNKLDLISSPKTYDEKGDYVSSPYFIVPCMLHSAPENFLQKYQNAATHRNLPIAFEFIHGFLPTATTYRILATCVMEFGELKKEDTIYCNCAVFNVFEHHYMTLEFTSSSIIANVLTFGKTRASISVCKAVREFLEDALKCIISSQRTSTNYSLLVACGYEDKRHKPAWLKWSTLMQQPEIICEGHKNEPPHVVKTEEILKQWSLVRSEEERLQNKGRKIHDRPIPEGKPNQLHLGRISRRIPSKDFHLLFIELGLNTNDIDRIEHSSPVQCILFLLLEWARRPGSTYKQLSDALYKQHSYVFDIEEMQSHNCEWRADIPETILKKEVADTTDLEFDKVCLMAGSCYFALGLELGLMKYEIDAIKADNQKCLPITREIIKSWINKNRPDDTWEVLGDALYEVGEDPDFIKNMCNANQDTPQ